MIGSRYWATGITLRHDAHTGGWSAVAAFYDDGFVNSIDGDVSTEGEIRTRHAVPGDSDQGAVRAALALKADAERLGIEFRSPVGPQLYLHTDNWISPDRESGTPELETAIGAVAEALGWTNARDFVVQ